MINSKQRQLTRLDRDSVLSRTTEEAIFEHYLRVPFKVGKLFCNPFREDRNPTCSFFISDFVGFKDWQGWFVGDCFGLVRKLYNCTYEEALVHICEDMRLNNVPAVLTPITREPPKPKELRVKRRDWEEHDKAFWSSFGIDESTLAKFSVAAVEKVWLEDDILYTNKVNDPCYVYHFIDYEYKLYFPIRGKDGRSKFITNCKRLQGFSQLDPLRPLCIITKSMKDVMVLDTFGINAVAPSSENGLIAEEIMEHLKERYVLVFLFDNDETGKKWGNANAEKYNVPAIYLPQDVAKDISDCVRDYGVPKTKTILKQKLCETLKSLHQQAQTSLDSKRLQLLTESLK